MNTMNTMISAILLSLLAVASADKMKIVNNCGADFKIGTVNIPAGTGVLCTPLVDFPADTDAEVDFFPNEDILVLQGAMVATSQNVGLIGLLKVLTEGQEDIDGKCAELYAYDTAAYSVQTGVPVVTLCANEPEDESGSDPTAEVSPSPDAAFSPSQAPETAPATETIDQITIENKCLNDFEFGEVRVNPRVNVVCSPMLVIPADKQYSHESAGAIEYLAVKTTSTKDTPNFQYLGTLQAIIDLEGDADGDCQKLVDSGYNAVYAPINAQMTLCA
jgi:hypothetical protein